MIKLALGFSSRALSIQCNVFFLKKFMGFFEDSIELDEDSSVLS